ncbi:unnamed protein product [Ectocarpus sp. 12 AP-2014]
MNAELISTAVGMIEHEGRADDLHLHHPLAILYGLRGYVNAARGEVEEARISASLMLDIVDLHAAILHHPLTFTLAEASRRLLTEARGGTPRPVPATARIALENMRYIVGYARPEEPGGGWSSFGHDILVPFTAAAAAAAAACRENRAPSSDQRTQLP